MLHIGRGVDPSTMEATDQPFKLDSRRLTRHAVCLGMTGSGKTGLCTALLEEIASAGVPVIAIDPKGDMTNLALAFRHHRPEDFLPWVDPAAASRKDRSVEEHAAHLSGVWQEGLERDGVTDERVAAFTEGVRVSVYTPGSSSGISVDVLGGLSQPPAGLDDEGLLSLAAGTASGLLGLVGVEADPVTDPEHIVLARLIEEQWRKGQPAGLDVLIPGLVDPPFSKVGVFPLDTFFPRKERMKLALTLNGVVASPTFSSWTQGVPLDVDALLQRGSPTPVHLFYTAHLDESQRLFFTAILLERIVAWSRRQPGSSGLRALLYFDEVYGYLPPHPRNPPTKRPVLTLLKQARAVGLGLTLVSQNPVDLDYKALSNAGLWMVGRLQTRQDRERVVNGLAGSDEGEVSKWLEDLPPRTFAVRDVSEDEPSLVYSRHVVSYLRGPLTLREVGRLGSAAQLAPAAPPPLPASAGGPPPLPSNAAAPPPLPAAAAAPPVPPAPVEPTDGLLPVAPPAPGQFPYRYLRPDVVLSPRLRQHFEAAARSARSDGRTVWMPALHAHLYLRFDEGKDWDVERVEHRLFFPLDGSRPLCEPDLDEGDFLGPAPTGLFGAIPADLDEHGELASARKRVVDEVLRGETERMFRHGATKLTSRAGEDRAAFEVRVRDALQDLADAEIAKLRERVKRQVDRLDERQTRLERDLDRYRTEARSRKTAEAVNVAEVVLSMFMGRRRSVGSVMTKRSQTRRSGEQASRREAELGDVAREVAELQADLARQMAAIDAEHRAMLDQVEELEVGLERSDISVEDFGILWIPVTRAV